MKSGCVLLKISSHLSAYINKLEIYFGFGIKIAQPAPMAYIKDGIQEKISCMRRVFHIYF